MRPIDLPLIRCCRLFRPLSEADLRATLTDCVVRSLSGGTVLCEQGERPEYLHVLLSGAAGLFVESGRQKRLLEFLSVGDCLNLPAVVLDAPYLVTARLLKESRLLQYPAPAFRARLRSNAALSNEANLQLSIHWRNLIAQIRELKLLSATERLVAYLLALCPRHSGPVTITLPGPHRLVAERLGVTPQSLSRSFATLRSLGVTSSRRQVSIADASRLRASAITQSQCERWE